LLVGAEENHSSRMSQCIDVEIAEQRFPSLERKGAFLNLILQYVIIDKMIRAINDSSTDNRYLSGVPKHRRRPIYTNKFKVSYLLLLLYTFSCFVAGLGSFAKLGQGPHSIERKISSNVYKHRICQRDLPTVDRTWFNEILVEQYFKNSGTYCSCKCGGSRFVSSFNLEGTAD
jgi:hypothetical protein